MKTKIEKLIIKYKKEVQSLLKVLKDEDLDQRSRLELQSRRAELILVVKDLEQILNEVAVDSGEVCTCTIFHSYKERHENLCSKTGKRIF